MLPQNRILIPRQMGIQFIRARNIKAAKHRILEFIFCPLEKNLTDKANQ